MNSGWSPAAYGRACASCAQAKCKCVVPDTDGPCARCRRLNRDCRPARRTRQINPMRRSVTAKTTQLERRLDQLTSLLQGNPRPSAPVLAALSDSGFSSGSQGHQAQPPSQGSTNASVGHCHRESACAVDEEILRSFRVERLPYLPFIYIPPATSASEIKLDSPFLWRCMVTLHCKDTARRAELHTELKTTAAKALLVDCQRSFDLLQGLLVYLGWIAFECQPRKISLGPYMQMVTGLVMDMGLNRPPPKDPDIPGAQFIRTGTGSCRPWVSLARTMDERRAILGCFLICSSLAHVLGRTDSMRWTPHMKECLDVLEDARQVPSDVVLAQLVRAQLVVEKVMKELGQDCEAVGDRDHRRAPLSFYLKGLQSQLDEGRSRAPDLSQNNTVLLHQYHAETTIYETAMAKTPQAHELDLTRLDYLYACLNAIRKRCDLLLTLTPSALAHIPSPTLLASAHSLATLLRLSTFEYPGWDTVAVRQTADVLSITQQLADKFAQVADTVGIVNPDDGETIDCFTTSSRILSGLRAGWASKVPPIETPGLEPENTNDPALPEFDQELIDNWLLSQDLAWLADFAPFGGVVC